jgi:Domain of unknown function (DUF6916)
VDSVTSESFRPHVGSAFAIQAADREPFELVLVSCTESTYGDADEWRAQIGRVPFSLIFRHEGAEEAIPQQTVAAQHPELGEFAVFLVPLGVDGDGVRYEAVFS